MTQTHIRPAVSTDISELTELDHGYSTDHVWQMGFQEEKNRINLNFQEVRLPRPMRVRYPRDPEHLIDHWTEKSVILVAEQEETLTGYLVLIEGPSPGSQWVSDLVVDIRHRQQGQGANMLKAAHRWASERDFQRLFLEMQSKNYPGIQLARKLGFHFSGYSDNYYPDDDIALFFVSDL
ncbi:MAG: GNAT family N-acetyltransferase [Anaerolineales bacterium]